MSCNSFSSKRIKLIAQKYTDVVQRDSETGCAIFTLQGARVLGLFPKKEGQNLLWVNSDFEMILKEQQPFVGGERLWLSPERSFFYENPRDFEGFHIPSEIDPGEYEHLENLQPEDKFFVFESKFSLLEYDNNNIFDANIARRQFALIPDPYKTGLDYIGVTISDTIAVNTPEIKMSVCSITQVCNGGYKAAGTAIVRSSPDTQFIHYYPGQVPPEWIEKSKKYSRFKIDSLKRYRTGLAPDAIDLKNPCKIIYIAPDPMDSSSWSCVIKRSSDLPQTKEQCVDIPRTNPQGSGAALKVFNSGPDSDNKQENIIYFGELELQFAKGKKIGRKTVSKATHELLGYRGTKEEMLALARTALSLSDTPELY